MSLLYMLIIVLLSIMWMMNSLSDEYYKLNICLIGLILYRFDLINEL
jgi:hypothetical protein